MEPKERTSVNLRAVDYKDVELLKRFINAHGRILNRRQTKLSAKHQRAIALAIKRARFMGFLPFVAR
jgi:small subunit ribosomal protein S18